MSSIGSNQSSKRWELVSIAECESSGLLVTFFMAWSPGQRFNAGDSRLITTETTPPSIPTNPATGPVLIGVLDDMPKGRGKRRRSSLRPSPAIDELKDQFRRFRTGHHPADLRRR